MPASSSSATAKNAEGFLLGDNTRRLTNSANVYEVWDEELGLQAKRYDVWSA